MGTGFPLENRGGVINIAALAEVVETPRRKLADPVGMVTGRALRGDDPGAKISNVDGLDRALAL
jgi:hypothetical protein